MRQDDRTLIQAAGQPPIGAGCAISEADFPLAALSDGQAALAIIVGIDGPSYRLLGTGMAIDSRLRRTGSLSSGCIEDDIALHARDVLRQNRPKRLRYGRGSSFADLELPCGGGLDVLVLPPPSLAVVEEARGALARRRTARLSLDLAAPALKAGEMPCDLRIDILPELQFLVFGKGEEARTFAQIAQLSGYLVQLCSPDADGLAALPGITTQHLASALWPQDLAADTRTAVTLFFHDHDWEPPILQHALGTPAFYVGAQGSLRAAETRRAALTGLGVAPEDLARLREPFGLIPSARDPRTLAISVLADALSLARVG